MHLTSSLILLITLLALGAGLASAQDDPRADVAYEAIDLNGGVDLMLARARQIDLNDYPVIPAIPPHIQAIFAHGQQLGRAAQVVSKVGDCNSTDWFFLHPFGEGQYTLGADYAYLQTAIDFYGESLATRTYAAHNGLNAVSALDPLWADPAACEAGETPLVCEYRVHNAAVALIMFGTNDVQVLTPEQFDHHLRRIVQITREQGVIPVLSTFPRHYEEPQRSILFNQIVVRVALDFNIPLINLWAALEPLPAHGIDDDGYHLNGPITGAGDFTSAANLDTGYPRRNLVTLQTLDLLRSAILDAGE